MGNTKCPAFLDHRPNGFNPLTVTKNPRQLLLFGPPTVTVHDDCKMLRDTHGLCYRPRVKSLIDTDYHNLKAPSKS